MCRPKYVRCQVVPRERTQHGVWSSAELFSSGEFLCLKAYSGLRFSNVYIYHEGFIYILTFEYFYYKQSLYFIIEQLITGTFHIRAFADKFQMQGRFGARNICDDDSKFCKVH